MTPAAAGGGSSCELPSIVPGPTGFLRFGVSAILSQPEVKTYRYVWGPRFRVRGLPVLDRKGEICRLLVRGSMNSALVEFADGYQAVVSRHALRRA